MYIHVLVQTDTPIPRNKDKKKMIRRNKQQQKPKKKKNPNACQIMCIIFFYENLSWVGTFLLLNWFYFQVLDP